MSVCVCPRVGVSNITFLLWRDDSPHWKDRTVKSPQVVRHSDPERSPDFTIAYSKKWGIGVQENLHSSPNQIWFGDIIIHTPGLQGGPADRNGAGVTLNMLTPGVPVMDRLTASLEEHFKCRQDRKGRIERDWSCHAMNGPSFLFYLILLESSWRCWALSLRMSQQFVRSKFGFASVSSSNSKTCGWWKDDLKNNRDPYTHWRPIDAELGGASKLLHLIANSPIYDGLASVKSC
jgi:hypothetical protein